MTKAQINRKGDISGVNSSFKLKKHGAEHGDVALNDGFVVIYDLSRVTLWNVCSKFNATDQRLL